MFIATAERIIASSFVFIETAERIIVTAERNRETILKKTFSSQNEGQPLTAVSRNGEKSGKFTFFFRKKYYLSGKYAVTKFATSASCKTSNCLITSTLFIRFSLKKLLQNFA